MWIKALGMLASTGVFCFGASTVLFDLAPSGTFLFFLALLCLLGGVGISIGCSFFAAMYWFWHSVPALPPKNSRAFWIRMALLLLLLLPLSAYATILKIAHPANAVVMAIGFMLLPVPLATMLIGLLRRERPEPGAGDKNGG